MTWTEIVIPVEKSPDTELLRDVLAALVDRSALQAWHYFWEPDLWIRLRWREGREDQEDRLREWLDAAVSEGRLAGWSFGHYEGDAEMMGAEMWERVEQDFQNGAEHALRLHALERDGALSRTRDFHWSRHVHCFSNQLVGTWSEEARLCVRLARYRVALLKRAEVNEPLQPRLTAILSALDGVLEEVDAVAQAEGNVVGAWRARGRPDIATLFNLPDDFDHDPG